MEGTGSQSAFTLPYTRHPTSPPATPGSNAHSRFPSTAGQTSPFQKRMGFAFLAQSPPLENIEPLGCGHQFRYTRSQSRDPPSRTSSASDLACASSHHDSPTNDDSQSENSDMEHARTIQTVPSADFDIEEVLETDPGYDNNTIEVVRPDKLEEANSDRGAEERFEGEGILRGIRNLQCEGGSDTEEELMLRLKKKKKRWSAGIFKRSHSQSIGSDTDLDNADALDAHGVSQGARRLRRRTRGPEDRPRMTFEDVSRPNIVEVEEPDDGGGGVAKAPPSLPSDEEGWEALPFWVVEDPMDVDIDLSSSRQSS